MQVAPLNSDNVPRPLMSEWNNILINKNAVSRVEWALENLPTQFVLTSSFGIQSAVMLHLMTQIEPNIPVILTDTEHLFPETYQFIEQLTDKLNLNLYIYKAKKSAAWQLKQYGKLWDKGSDELKHYHYMNKIEPLDRAMRDLKANTWFSGVRQQQSSFRKSLSVVDILRGHFKVHPILEWSNQDIHQYLTKHQLPYNPLYYKGYVSVGDVHSSLPISDTTKNEGRLLGHQRECGLHSVDKM